VCHTGKFELRISKLQVVAQIKISIKKSKPINQNVTESFVHGSKTSQKSIKVLFMKLFKSFILSIGTFLFMHSTYAQKMMNEETVQVGGAPMYPSKNIVENAVNSKDHTTLVAAVKAAGLVETLQGAGPFTVFAPTNEAFNLLPAGTVESLLKPENKSKLTAILAYHVISGRMGTKELDAKIKEGKGTAELTTVAGGKLWVNKKAGKYMLKDENGGMATITIKNVYQSNGVIHVIDQVVIPK
jgi:uncharacterized surface protein with fasciclin (FAS1) repeats